MSDAAALIMRRALIRLLWRECEDGGGCVCEVDAKVEVRASWDRQVTDTCEAMRALGWGSHWNAERFARLAVAEEKREKRERRLRLIR